MHVHADAYGKLSFSLFIRRFPSNNDSYYGPDRHSSPINHRLWQRDHMADFKVTVDATPFIAARRDFEKKQLPFALASTLTAVAQDAQKAMQNNVRNAFRNRNTWTVQGIRIKPADRNTHPVQADVHTDTANRKTGAPDYLGRQEDGGEKVPVQGRHFIAVPTKYLRVLAPGVIPAELRPRALLGAVNGRYGRTKRNGQIALQPQTLVKGFVFFLAKLKSGHMAILGRHTKDRDAYPFYLLISEAHIKKSGLRMEETVKKIANERFADRWDSTWNRIYSNGLKI
jgi:hypothetical protein